MTSPPLDSTYGWTTSGMTCNHRLWAAHTVERCRAWHAIIALGRKIRSNDVRHGMPSSPLGSTNGRKTSGVACHHSPWTANMVERPQALHSITNFGQHTRSNDFGHRMPSSPLENTHGRTTSNIACHHRLRAAHAVRRRRACHEITALRQHTRSATSGVA